MIEILPGGHVIIESLSVLIVAGVVVVCFGIWQWKRH